MRLLAIVLMTFVALASAACRGSIDERAASELKIFNAADDSLISDGDDWGTITLAPGGTMQLRITRTTSHANGDIEVDDVTTQVSFNSKTAGVATISPGGLVTGSAAGTSEVEVEFDDGDTDTTDNDLTRFFVTVSSAI
jgi:hypothetical protein